jgi:hypothetical protein
VRISNLMQQSNQLYVGAHHIMHYCAMLYDIECCASQNSAVFALCTIIFQQRCCGHAMGCAIYYIAGLVDRQPAVVAQRLTVMHAYRLASGFSRC